MNGATTAAAIERPALTINSVRGALDEATCRFEQVRVLFGSALGEAHDLATSLPSPGGSVSASIATRCYENWLVLEIIRGQFADIEAIVCAVTEKVYAEHQAEVAA